MNNVNGFSALFIFVLILISVTVGIVFGFLYFLVNLEITDLLVRKFWTILLGLSLFSGVPVGFYILVLWARKKFNIENEVNQTIKIEEKTSSPIEKDVTPPPPYPPSKY